MKTNVTASAGLRFWTWFFCVAALGVQAPLPAIAETAVVLDLAEARSRAQAANPGLAEMQARYEALSLVAPQKSALPDPVVSLNAMNLPWNSFDLNQEPMTQMQVGISQMFPFPGKLGLREDVALFEARAALYSVDEMRLNLDRNVAVGWWEIYYLDRALETVQRNHSLLRQFVIVARKKYEVGNGLQQDVLLAQLELSRLQEQEIRLRAMRELQLIRLNVLMDVSPDMPARLPTTVPQPEGGIASEANLYRRAMAIRPVLSEKAALIEASESRLQLAEKDYYPDFKVGVLYGDRKRDEFGNPRKDFLSVMFSVNIPLYASARQSSAVEQRARELAKSQYALADERNLVRSAISMALSDYRRASQQMALFGGGIIPQARQTVESMQAGYQVDEVDFLNLVRSQVTLFNYELQNWKAFTEVKQSLTRLKAAVGEDNIYE